MLVAMGPGAHDRDGGSRLAATFSDSPRRRQRIRVRICAAVSFMFLAGCLNAQTGACDVLPARTPDDINALASTGLALSHAKKYDAAAVCYRKILAIDPNIPQIQLNLGLAEFKSGRFREAAERFQTVLKLDPKNTQAPTLLGMSY
jgi:tetratricopeptide (TPR) repeat protein